MACCSWLQVGSRNQISKDAHDCTAAGSFNLASSMLRPAVARAVGTWGARAIASMMKDVAEIVTAIFFNIANHPITRA